MKLVKQTKRTHKCLKLKHKKARHMHGLSSLKVWDNPPLAPPA